MRIETATFEYNHCGECPHTEIRDNKKVIWYCMKTDKDIPDLWGEIPDFCPLPCKVEFDGLLREVREDERETFKRNRGSE